MKQDTFLILKLLLTFLKELVVGKWSFSAKCPRLLEIIAVCDLKVGRYSELNE